MLNKMLSSHAVYDFQEPWSTMKKARVPPYVILRSEGGGGGGSKKAQKLWSSLKNASKLDASMPCTGLSQLCRYGGSNSLEIAYLK